MFKGLEGFGAPPTPAPAPTAACIAANSSAEIGCASGTMKVGCPPGYSFVGSCAGGGNCCANWAMQNGVCNCNATPPAKKYKTSAVPKFLAAYVDPMMAALADSEKFFNLYIKAKQMGGDYKMPLRGLINALHGMTGFNPNIADVWRSLHAAKLDDKLLTTDLAIFISNYLRTYDKRPEVALQAAEDIAPSIDALFRTIDWSKQVFTGSGGTDVQSGKQLVPVSDWRDIVTGLYAPGIVSGIEYDAETTDDAVKLWNNVFEYSVEIDWWIGGYRTSSKIWSIISENVPETLPEAMFTAGEVGEYLGKKQVKSYIKNAAKSTLINYMNDHPSGSFKNLKGLSAYSADQRQAIDNISAAMLFVSSIIMMNFALAQGRKNMSGLNDKIDASHSLDIRYSEFPWGKLALIIGAILFVKFLEKNKGK